jgi:hypothetical protein
MFQYDKDTLCKVLDLLELDFYQSMPDSLKKFTPEFRGRRPALLSRLHSTIALGTITVQYCEDELGYIKLFAPPQATSSDDEHSSNEENGSGTAYPQATDNSSRKLVQYVFGGKETNVRECSVLSSYRLRCSKDGRIDYSNSVANDIVNYEQGKITMAKINPWSLQLCKKQAEKLHQELIDAGYVTVSQSNYSNRLSRSRSHLCIEDLQESAEWISCR